ncbi:uncharacterized protein A1O9_03918 [Exophiala aquamarina CBS 119918]|uniref:Uncharacterized protein n=1 Tax=Exophiala aquamarina CBS 119918 TaxID=1182545 RepID=A0A072PU53_9EURO|nr:uncharacterized protein A1O9_03918 [Exophiala aquamarina CBS 119918]KEF59075.1 hypothetical protein A1O9_03918 [Exophiala aquamarina CBS 119918]
MYDDACETIEVAMELDATEQFADYAPFFNNTMVLLAAFVILRIGKSHLRENVDQHRGKRGYFAAIAMSKRHSLSGGPMGRQIAFGFGAEVASDLAYALTVFGFGDKNLGVNLVLMTRFRMSLPIGETRQQGPIIEDRSRKIP